MEAASAGAEEDSLRPAQDAQLDDSHVCITEPGHGCQLLGLERANDQFPSLSLPGSSLQKPLASVLLPLAVHSAVMTMECGWVSGLSRSLGWMGGKARQKGTETREVTTRLGRIHSSLFCLLRSSQLLSLGNLSALWEIELCHQALWIPSTEPVLQGAAVLIPTSSSASTLAPTWPGPSLRNFSGATEPMVVSRTHLEASFPLLGSWSTNACQCPGMPAYSATVTFLMSQEAMQPPISSQ